MPRKFAGIPSLYLFTSTTSFAGFNKEKRESPERDHGVPPSRPREARTGITGRGRITKTVSRLSSRIGGVRYRNGPRHSGQQWIRVWFCDWELWLRMAAPSQRVCIPTSCIQIMWFVGGLRTFWKFPSPLDERRGANRRGEHRRRSSLAEYRRSIVLNRTSRREWETRKFFDPGPACTLT